VRALVEAGANPRIPDRDGVPPLQHAEARGYVRIASFLSQAGR
jgi:ankyrin repeat protein